MSPYHHQAQSALSQTGGVVIPRAKSAADLPASFQSLGFFANNIHPAHRQHHQGVSFSELEPPNFVPLSSAC
jgi:hypothetical protein